MILKIDTTLDNHYVYIAASQGGIILAEKKFGAKYQQAEKLLAEIEKLLKENKRNLSDLEAIEVESRGGTFTSLRIGVTTANALGFALGIPVLEAEDRKYTLPANRQEIKINKSINIIEPKYNREPIIS